MPSKGQRMLRRPPSVRLGERSLRQTQIMRPKTELIEIIERGWKGKYRHAFLDQFAGIAIFRCSMDGTFRDKPRMNFARLLGKIHADVLGDFENALSNSIEERPRFEVMLAEKRS